MMNNKIDIFKMIHTSLSNGIRRGKSQEAKGWLDKKGLSIDLTHACYNSGQMHHGGEDDFIEELKSVGFLKENGINRRKENRPPAYASFGKESIVFPLRNPKNEVVNFFAMSIKKEKNEYLNHEGLYPCYPPAQTTRLYITDNILDAATLLQIKILDNRDAVMALHGGELKDEHRQAISELKNLKEIILIAK